MVYYAAGGARDIKMRKTKNDVGRWASEEHQKEKNEI
jgi:hypothetical protein